MTVVPQRKAKERKDDRGDRLNKFEEEKMMRIGRKIFFFFLVEIKLHFHSHLSNVIMVHSRVLSI